MNFGKAIKALKKGKRVARKGWNGKNMWLILQFGSRGVIPMRPGSAYAEAGLVEVKIQSHIDMMCADGTMQPGWLASQADMLSDDWCVL